MTSMKLHGIFVPLITPFESDGSVALGQVRNNVALFNKTKLAGYVPNGSTSESVLLRWEEVYKVWEAVRDAAAPEKILIAGTGAESTAETIEHTNRAAKIGYAVALVRTPSFYKPSINDHMLAEHYLRVADAVRIPVMVYSVPVFTHVTVGASLIERVAKHPNIVGLKDSSGDVAGSSRDRCRGAERISNADGFGFNSARSVAGGRGGRDSRAREPVSGFVRGDLPSGPGW